MLRTTLTWPLVLTAALITTAGAVSGCNGDDDPVDTGDIDTDTDDDTDTDTEAASDAGDTIEDAYAVAPTFGEFLSITDAISEGGDRDFFQLAQQQGNWYFVFANRPGDDGAGGPAGGEPDTVVRLYNGEGELLSTNDDMPFRLENTDGGMWWQATSNDPMYVEVLEWTDWRAELGDDWSPEGGQSWLYDLIVFETDSEELVGENDTIQECFAGTAGSLDAIGLTQSQAMWFGNGLIDSPEDVDVFELGAEGFTGLPEDSDLLCQFGFWPDQPSDLSPRVRLYWEDCEPTEDDDGDCDGQGDDIYLLGESEEADLTPTGRFLSEDPAVMAAIPDGRFYVEVSSATGEGGPGHFYTLTYSCFITSNFQQETETGSVDPTEADIVPLDNPNDAQYFFGRFYGNFNGETTDDFDAFALVDGLGDGKYVNVILESAKTGATTGDITMTLWRNEGGGNFTELTSVTGPDPEIVDYQIGADDFALVVTLQTDGSQQGLSTNYWGLATVYPEPSNE